MATQATRREQQKKETYRLILQAAKDLFIEHGFEKTTLRMISKKAGVAVGTIFVHFDDKPSLLAATFHKDLERVTAESFSRLPDGPVEHQLVDLTRSFFDYYAETMPLSRTLLKETIFLQGEWGERFNQQAGGFVLRVITLLQVAQQAGEISLEVDCQLVGSIFWSHYWLCLFNGLRQKDFDSASRVLEFERLMGPVFQMFH
jgi:AcrR family transcriptional regulator